MWKWGGGGGLILHSCSFFMKIPHPPFFFSLLSQIPFLVSKTCIKLKDILLQKLINIRCWLTLSMIVWIYVSFKAIAKKKYFLNTWRMHKKEQCSPKLSLSDSREQSWETFKKKHRSLNFMLAVGALSWCSV